MSEKKSRGLRIVARQGDVLIIDPGEPVAVTESHRVVPREDGGVVLAYGEVTGHRHQFRDPGVCLLRAEGVHDAVLRVTDDVATMLHEEHAPVCIPRGDYIARIQREYVPGELPRDVQD